MGATWSVIAARIWQGQGIFFLPGRYEGMGYDACMNHITVVNMLRETTKPGDEFRSYESKGLTMAVCNCGWVSMWAPPENTRSRVEGHGVVGTCPFAQCRCHDQEGRSVLSTSLGTPTE